VFSTFMLYNLKLDAVTRSVAVGCEL